MSEDVKKSELQIRNHQKKITSENFFTSLYTLSRVSCKEIYKVNVYKNTIFNMKNIYEKKTRINNKIEYRINKAVIKLNSS